jgi:hypothetical protein
MYVNVMETLVQKEVRDLSRVLAHVLTDCLLVAFPAVSSRQP